jgi:hypothetical protein
MKNLKLRYATLLVFVCGLLVLPLFQIKPMKNNGAIYDDKNDIELDNSADLPSDPNAQDNYDIKTLPFFKNSTPIFDWLTKQLIDNETAQSSALFFAESNQTGSGITDDRHYIEDIAVFMDGLAYVLGVSEISIPSYFSTQKNTKLWDSNVSQTGFYTYTNREGNQNSSVKELNGNAQSLITFADWLISENPQSSDYGVSTILKSQWDVIMNLFWDGEQNNFNHSDADDSKYMEDQFIAAISGFKIHRSSYDSVNNVTQSQANATATAVMKQLTNVSKTIYNDESFDYKRNKDLQTTGADHNKDLATNAYGISALLEWYIESGANTWDQPKLDMAEKLFLFLNNSLWNDTYSLYMKKSTQNGGGIIDERIILEDNAIMMSALKRLFEITGNFTYFQTIMDMYTSISDNFLDPDHGTYYSWINTTSGMTNTNKSLRTHSYLFRAFAEVSTLSQYVKTEINTNSTNYIKGEMNTVNITAKYYLDYELRYSVPGTSIEINTPVQNCTHFISVRYPNSTVILANSYTSDINGTTNFNLNIQSQYPIGEYLISMYSNYTGLQTIFNNSIFNVDSGINLDQTHTNLVSTNLRAGETTNMNVSINSTRANSMNTTIKIYGMDIMNDTDTPKLALNQSLSNYTFTIQTLSTSTFGAKYLTVELYDGTLLYSAYNLSYSIISPVDITDIKESLSIFRGKQIKINIQLKNFINSAQNLSIVIYGDYIVQNQTSKYLAANEVSSLVLMTQLKNNAPFGLISYTINITRISDGALIYQKVFSSNLMVPIRITYFETPEISRHFEETSILCKIFNNMAESQIISVYVDGEKIDSLTSIVPGENVVKIPIGNKFINPFEFGFQSFKVVIKDADGNVIYQEQVSTTLEVSAGSMLIFIIPLLLPIIAMVTIRHISLENKKRLS